MIKIAWLREAFFILEMKSNQFTFYMFRKLKMITADLTIAQIREIRHQISQQFNHDPKKIIEYYMELQKKYQYRLFNISNRKQKVADEFE